MSVCSSLSLARSLCAFNKVVKRWYLTDGCSVLHPNDSPCLVNSGSNIHDIRFAFTRIYSSTANIKPASVCTLTGCIRILRLPNHTLSLCTLGYKILPTVAIHSTYVCVCTFCLYVCVRAVNNVLYEFNRLQVA